jgi:(p)ppGpp synthase/HD superfamily hydrolase
MAHEQLSGAAALARIAHKGQTRMDGVEPYINHPYRVVRRLRKNPNALYEDLVVGWLHDVVEDTEVTFDDLRAFWFDENVIAAVYALTRQQGEVYADYIERVALNQTAVRVKIADLEDNLASLPVSTPGGYGHTLQERYRRALRRLENL